VHVGVVDCSLGLGERKSYSENIADLSLYGVAFDTYQKSISLVLIPLSNSSFTKLSVESIDIFLGLNDIPGVLLGVVEGFEAFFMRSLELSLVDKVM
jgi:hypothetical protein